MTSIKYVYGFVLINLFCASMALADAKLPLIMAESFNPIDLNCAQLKMSNDFFKTVSLETQISWTEDPKIIQVSALDHYPNIINILNNILDFQNQRTLGCPRPNTSNHANLYRKFLSKKNDAINISVGIGYNDQRPDNFVWDEYLTRLISFTLLAPCKNIFNKNCGFKPISWTPNFVILSKEIWDNKQLIVTLFFSALSTNDELNRKNPKQIESSQSAQQQFYNSLGNADFAFYLGHSRNGGGPDFYPPKIMDNLHTDYKWYNQTQLQKTEMIRVLEKLPANKKPALVGLLGCSSQLHFYKKLKEASPTTAFILSKNAIYTFEYFQGLFSFINGIQLKKSVEEINIDIEATNIPHRTNGTSVTPLLLLLGGRK